MWRSFAFAARKARIIKRQQLDKLLSRLLEPFTGARIHFLVLFFIFYSGDFSKYTMENGNEREEQFQLKTDIFRCFFTRPYPISIELSSQFYSKETFENNISNLNLVVFRF